MKWSVKADLINKSLLMPILAIVIITSLMSVGQAYAAVDMFLKIDGIPGESVKIGHEKEIDVLSWSWGASGGGTGKVSVHDISITKLVDKATPKLMEGVLAGKHFPEATITVRKAGDKPLEFVKYTIKDVIITSSSTAGKADEDKPSESITLNFARLETIYTPYDDKGKPLPVVTFCWDFKLNVLCTVTIPPTDSDGDGFASDVDCDDTNPAINPGATEIQDGIDNDCDGQIDEGFGGSDQIHQDTLQEVRNIEEKLDGGRDSLVFQISDKLNSIANDISSLLTSTGQVLGILQDPNFGLHEIKSEVGNIEERTKTIETKVGEISNNLGQIGQLSNTFIDTETISLTGKLKKGDYKLLMDITPFKSITGHVAMKVPCDKKGITDLAIVAGVAPAVSPIPMSYIAALSDPGNSCLYHGDLGLGITDIAIINTSTKGPVEFGDEKTSYSVTITIQGTLLPVINSFTPISGGVGTPVTINGINFAGVTDVKFNGVSSSPITIISPTSIKVMVPLGATSGKIMVTNQAGTAPSVSVFTVLP